MLRPTSIPVIAVSAILLGIGGCSDKDPAPLPAAARTAKQSDVSDGSNSNRLDRLFDVLTSKHAATRSGIRPRFRDAASDLGVRFRRFNDFVPNRYFLPEVMGGGVAWFDFDRDGYLDLYATDGCRLWDPDPTQAQHVNRLFRNRGSKRFDDATVPSLSGDNRYGQGCAVGDFDADGFPDLYVTNFGRNTLLVNNGDGTFEDVTSAAGVGDESWGTSAVWFDANSDGLADLFLVNYLPVTRSNHRVCKYGGVEGYCGPGQWKLGVDDVLYLNLGDGRFQTAAKAKRIETRHAKGLAVAVCDFDSDGRPEIYVANDMAPNFLLTRLSPAAGRRLYRNVAEAAGCALSGDGRNEASMGIACADFDGDRLVDIFLTHYYQHKNTLYRNLGSLRFEDDSRRSRIAAASFQSLGFGTVAFDYDHDEDEDLFIANGHVLGPKHSPNEMNPQLLENDGKGIFNDVSKFTGGYFLQPVLGRGAAGGDYDNDGRVDLAVSHLDQPLSILHNETRSPHHFIGLELQSSDRIHPAGGRVHVIAGGRRRVIPIIGGGSYLSSGDARIVVGLGRHRGSLRVEVIWRPGRKDTFEKLTTGRYWLLREGKAALPTSG